MNIETLQERADNSTDMREVQNLRTAIIAITSYEQMAEQYPTMAEEYKKKIEEILNYFNN